MDSILLNYIGGDEIRAGDRIRYQGLYGTVVFVSDGENEQVAPGYQDYRGAERGVVLCDDDGNVDAIGEPGETLEFLGRG